MQINVDAKQLETKLHGSEDFPVLISDEALSNYDNSHFLFHWHPEIEFTYILKGKIGYSINNIEYHLEEGDGLFCNSNILHSGKQFDDEDCSYLSITVHPRILYGFETSRIKYKYIEEITKNHNFPSYPFKKEDPAVSKLLDDLISINRLHKADEELNEMHLLLLIYSLWLNLFELYSSLPEDYLDTAIHAKDYERLRTILFYIHSHYSEKISLEDISDKVNLSKNECCRFFKKHMSITIFEYIKKYRINQSIILLDNTDLNVIDIAYEVGFPSPSYYTSLFKKYNKLTPKKYRERIWDEK